MHLVVPWFVAWLVSWLARPHTVRGRQSTGAGGKVRAKCAKVKRFGRRNRSRRRAGAQKIVLRSDFVVVPP
jgi:hypothetical protein